MDGAPGPKVTLEHLAPAPARHGQPISPAGGETSCPCEFAPLGGLFLDAQLEAGKGREVVHVGG